jgi:hypothetical protein
MKQPPLMLRTQSIALVWAIVGCTDPNAAITNTANLAGVEAQTATTATTAIEAVLAKHRAAAASHGATLELEANWASADTSFTPSTEAGRKWRLRPQGGLLKKGFTTDGWTLASCHELGHFFGGFPFGGLTVERNEDRGTVQSSEGQADYFATKDCLPRMWGDQQVQNASFREKVDATAKAACDRAWQQVPEQDLCYRASAAALDLLVALARDQHPTFATPDPSLAKESKSPHTSQSRLDTLLAGALCHAKSDLSVIPGLMLDASGTKYGLHSVASEQAAKPYACHGMDEGARPRSWFRPDMPDLGSFDCASFGSLSKCEGARQVYCVANEGLKYRDCTQPCKTSKDGEGLCGESVDP